MLMPLCQLDTVMQVLVSHIRLHVLPVASLMLQGVHASLPARHSDACVTLLRTLCVG